MIRIYVDISTSKYIYYYFFKGTDNQIRVLLFFRIWTSCNRIFLGELPDISLLVLINDTEQNRAKRQQFSKAFDHVNSFKEESLWTYKARLPQLILCEVSEGRWNPGVRGTRGDIFPKLLPNFGLDRRITFFFQMNFCLKRNYFRKQCSSSSFLLTYLK